jgi:hypothetical protein
MNVFLVDSPEGMLTPRKSPGALFFWLLLPIFHGFLLTYPTFIGTLKVYL